MSRELATSEKIANSLRGKFGDKSRGWKGEDAGYVAKHMWIVKHFGKACKCENKGCKSVSPKRFEWANISGKYKRNRSDYKMLCPSCHRRADYGNKCKNGHEFDAKNTYISKSGWRICRKCQSNRNKEYYKRNKQ